MKPPALSLLRSTVVCLLGSLAFHQVCVRAQTPQEHVVALKASLAASQAILKQYEWIETTVVSVKGDEKSRQMNRCYYGADGKVQKLPVTSPPPQEKKRGLRGRIAERKKEEMTEFMQNALAVVKQYVPPDPLLIQRAKDRNHLTVQPLSGQKARLTFNDYVKPGDSLALVVDLSNNRPIEAKIATHVNSKQETVTLNVQFKTLDNNASYAANAILDAAGEGLQVTVENSGYRRQ